ncbi:MAG: phosphate ABC transporter permease subunit PstC [Christensenellales bacterium]
MNRSKFKENASKCVFTATAIICIIAVVAIFAFLIAESVPAFKEIGFLKFLFGDTWEPSASDKYGMPLAGTYGVFKMIVGTLVATCGSVVVGGLIGFFTAVFISAFCPIKLKKIFSTVIHLLAGIPSVIFGFFGMKVLLPGLGVFSSNGSGSGLLAVSLVLGLMILPTVVSLSKTSIEAVPAGYYEGARALGASHEQAIFTAVVPAAKSGIAASIILGIGRSVGETMAVIMVAGNKVNYPGGFFQSFRVLTANIVMEMGYAGEVQLGALIATGVVLLLFILMINVLLGLVTGKRKKDKGGRKHTAGALSGIIYKLKPERIGKIISCVAAGVAAGALLSIIAFIVIMGVPHLNWQLLFGEYVIAGEISILPSIAATFMTVLVSLAVAIPVGVATAVYLNEYTKKGSRLVRIIRGAIDVLSGIPSIVYALFGMVTFVVWFGGKMSVLAGSFTVAVMLLPVVVRSTEESLKSVQDSLREGSLALGAGKLRTIFKIVLPSALPGIMSAVILSMGRVVSESAPFIYTMGSTIMPMPKGFTDSGTTLAVALYKLSGEGRYTDEAYATAFVLLVIVLALNLTAGFIEKRLNKKLKGETNAFRPKKRNGNAGGKCRNDKEQKDAV